VLQTTARGAAQARAAAERAAVNHPIQGTAADILKIAMLNVHRSLREQGYAARMILQVHDEIVLQVPEAELAAIATLVVETMEEAYELAVPLKAEPEYGRDWYDLEAWLG
jgi:DNA polymerase-1